MNKRIRAVSPATPPAAVIAPAGRAYAAEAGDGDPAYTKTVREFKEGARELPEHDTGDRKSPEQRADGPDTGYGAPFEAAIWEIRAGTGARGPAGDEIPATIDRITYGTAGDEGTRIVHGGEAPGARDGGFFGAAGIPPVGAACPATADPGHRRVRTDMDGGTCNGHRFDGDGGLHTAGGDLNAETRETAYALHFYGGDRPTGDALYGGSGWIMRGRTRGIGPFTIQNYTRIKSCGTRSSADGCAGCLADPACHYTAAKTRVPGRTAHVSDARNRMTDTPDTGRIPSKVGAPQPLFLP